MIFDLNKNEKANKRTESTPTLILLLYPPYTPEIGGWVGLTLIPDISFTTQFAIQE